MNEIGQEVFKRQTGSAPTFQSIDGVGPKTAEKVKGTIIEGEGRIQAPPDVSDLTDDQLADKAGISKTRARKVIKGAGGNPDREPRRRSTGSVEAGNIAEGLDSATRDAATTVEQRRDLFEGVVEIGEDVPDRRERRRGNFGPLEDEDPERVRELGRAAETFQQATRDPIDPTEEQRTFGFDPDEARERAAQVSLAATRFLEQERGLEFDEARSTIEGRQPDLNTADSAVSNLVGGGMTGGGTLRGPSRPTDIGRDEDGEFERPETARDVEPAPIARNRESGRFGLDPFDFTAGGVGRSVSLLGGGTDTDTGSGGGAMGVSLTSEDRSVLETLARSNMASGDRPEKIEEARLSEDPGPEAREAVVETGESILNFREEIEDTTRTDTDFFTGDDLDRVDSVVSKFRGGSLMARRRTITSPFTGGGSDDDSGSDDSGGGGGSPRGIPTGGFAGSDDDPDLGDETVGTLRETVDYLETEYEGNPSEELPGFDEFSSAVRQEAKSRGGR